MIGQDLLERIEALFDGDVRAESSLGLAQRLGVDEDAVLGALIALVANRQLHLIEEGGLLIALTPEYSRALDLAA